MHKYTRNQRRLAQTVLASTLFVAPIAAQAITITGTVNTTQDTATDGTIILEPSGQIDTSGVGDAILVDSTGPTGGKVSILSSNIHGAQAVTTDDFNGVNFVPSASLLGRVVIGPESGITVTPTLGGTTNAILVQSDLARIINGGTVQVQGNGTGAVINIAAGGTNTSINNNLGGVIQDSGFATQSTILVQDTGFSLFNTGTITQTTTGVDTITIDSSFDGLFNGNLGLGVIQQTDPNGVGNTGHAINITSNSGGDLLVNSPGSRITTAAAADTVLVSASMGLINNSGSVTAVGGRALNLDSSAGPIGFNEINNFDTAVMLSKSDTNPTIATTGGNLVTLSNGLVNKGIITSTGASNTAIDFKSSPTTGSIFQQGGSIGGNIFLAQAPLPGASIFVMDAGVITGNVTAQSVDLNTINVNGGTIDGALTLGDSGDTFFLTGTGFVNVIQGGANVDSFNIFGGNFNLLDGGGLTDFVNIDQSFSTNGTINNVGFININGFGTVFTANGPMTNITRNLVINPGTTLIPNNLISLTGIAGTDLLNLGLINVTGLSVIQMRNGATFANGNGNFPATLFFNDGVITLDGGATQNVFESKPGSSIVELIDGSTPGGPVSAGGMFVNSTQAGSVVRLDQGSFLVPKFIGFIPQGTNQSVFIVNDGTNTNGYISDSSTLIQPSSAVVSFSRALVNIVVNGIIEGEELQLIANRNSYTSLADGPAVGVAGALDVLALGAGPTNTDFFTLLSQLDQLPTGEDVDEAMDSLTPPFNFGLIEASHIGMDSVFEGVTDRVWDVAWHHQEHGRRHSGRNHGKQKISKGINSGDLVNRGGVWIRPIGAYVSQSERDDVDGYRAKAIGAAIGADWGMNDCTTFGVAVSYTKVSVDDKNEAPKDESIKAWMGTLYGSFDFSHGIFLDAMVAGASNDYKVNRVIAVNDLLTGAHASFDGTQWGVQGDLGMALPNETFFAAPFVRLKYVHVDIDGYTETGAGDLSLTVSDQDADEFLGGIGLRVATDFVAEGIEWVPEFTVMVAYDFDNDGEVTAANFIGGGPAFTTDGVTPGRTIFDAGLALNALICANSVVTAKYNLELREAFVGNSAYLQYFYNWG